MEVDADIKWLAWLVCGLAHRLSFFTIDYPRKSICTTDFTEKHGLPRPSRVQGNHPAGELCWSNI
jgi:hypothetical protein